MPKKNDTLGQAKADKNDEFYTQYEDVQREINAYLEYNPDTFKNKTVLLPCDDPEWSNFTKFFAQNFENLGLKKLISTSYATESKNQYSNGYQFTIEDFLTDYETKSPQYNKAITGKKGKIFTLTRDTNNSGNVDIDDLEWSYLDGDGDFRSEEVKKLRDESDIIITNPPFSLFREFVAWIMEANKQFVIVGNQNAITYKEIFPLIKDNKMWLGKGFPGNVGFFGSIYEDKAMAGEHQEGKIRVSGVMWFTNLDHGRRHQPLSLMSMEDNLKYSKHKEIKENGYPRYDNYDAIEIPYSDAIPSDYDGIMGVPITYIPKYNPEQFLILGSSNYNDTPCLINKNYTELGYLFYKSDNKTISGSGALRDKMSPKVYGKGGSDYSISPSGEYLHAVYNRIFIKYTDQWINEHPEDFKEN